MSEAHTNEELQPFIEEHQNSIKASELFTIRVEIFKDLKDKL